MNGRAVRAVRNSIPGAFAFEVRRLKREYSRLSAVEKRVARRVFTKQLLPPWAMALLKLPRVRGKKSTGESRKARRAGGQA